MTFEEAFNSGCRFKLPEGYGEEINSWPSDWWWIKENSNEVRILGFTPTYQVKRLDILFSGKLGNRSTRDLLYKNSKDWYLHPKDEHNWKFGKKLEDLIETA